MNTVSSARLLCVFATAEVMIPIKSLGDAPRGENVRVVSGVRIDLGLPHSETGRHTRMKKYVFQHDWPALT